MSILHESFGRVITPPFSVDAQMIILDGVKRILALMDLNSHWRSPTSFPKFWRFVWCCRGGGLFICCFKGFFGGREANIEDKRLKFTPNVVHIIAQLSNVFVMWWRQWAFFPSLGLSLFQGYKSTTIQGRYKLTGNTLTPIPPIAPTWNTLQSFHLA